MHSKTTLYRLFLVSLWKVVSPQLDKQTTKNKRTTGYSSAIPQVKKGLYLGLNPSPNYSLTPKRSNGQANNDVTKQSLEMSRHFGNVFVKTSAVFVLLTCLLFFTTQEKKIHISFLLNASFFVALKCPKKRCLNFGSFDL